MPAPSSEQALRDHLRQEIINTPETADFMAGVPLEAAHQRQRWSVGHDAGKGPFDWFWLIGYLAQKAADAATRGDIDKAKHHTISTAAALANWHAALSGADTSMRPGIADPSVEIPDDVRRLVIAARCVLDMGGMDDEHCELDKAAEAFASRVPYENQPETFDFEISDDGVMTALPTWQRNNEGTFLRLMLVDGHATTEADVAGWTDEQCQQADIWAWTTHLSASDNEDIKVPPRPDFLTAGNHAAHRHPITGEPE